MPVYLSLGSNLGEKKANLEKAIQQLKNTPGIELEKISSLYETEAWGGVEQDSFYNIVIQVKTELEPYELLQRCQEIEKDLGRVRDLRWGPRTIDIDILTYENFRISTKDLTIPHPYMEKREFVLAPLREIAPLLRLPSGKLIKNLRGEGKIKKISSLST